MSLSVRWCPLVWGDVPQCVVMSQVCPSVWGDVPQCVVMYWVCSFVCDDVLSVSLSVRRCPSVCGDVLSVSLSVWWCPLPCGDMPSVHLWLCARAPEHPPDLLTSTSVTVGLENIYHRHQDAHGGGLDVVCVCVCVCLLCVLIKATPRVRWCTRYKSQTAEPGLPCHRSRAAHHNMVYLWYINLYIFNLKLLLWNS